MSIFQSLLDKLGFHKDTEVKPPATPAPKPAVPPNTPVVRPTPTNVPPRPVGYPPAAAVNPPAQQFTPMSMVDVVSKLDNLAAKNPQQTNWQTSIADMMFLLGMDNSFKARKALAVELGCPEKLMADSAQMNTWLHSAVLKKLAERGGNIPERLLVKKA
jgi:hypothetical protein